MKVKGDERFGVMIVEKALEAPLAQIAENAGEDGSVVVEMVREKGGSVGFNALTLEYVDMFKAGIIDPAKVVRTALVNAASIAGLLLTTDSLINRLKEGRPRSRAHDLTARAERTAGASAPASPAIQRLPSRGERRPPGTSSRSPTSTKTKQR